MANGCEKGACELAKMFYTKNERIIRRLRFRRELSDLYIATFHSWAPPEVITNPALHRTFSQVLYALVNDGKVLRISNSRLLWANNSAPHHRPRRLRHSSHVPAELWTSVPGDPPPPPRPRRLRQSSHVPAESGYLK